MVNATGTTLYVIGMLITSFALRPLPAAGSSGSLRHSMPWWLAADRAGPRRRLSWPAEDGRCCSWTAAAGSNHAEAPFRRG